MQINFKTILYLILIFNISPGCNNQKKVDINSTVIEGHLQNPLSNKIYFCTYIDSNSLFLGNKTAIDSSQIDDKGYYSFLILNKTPLVFNLESDSKILASNLFLIPGHHLQIDFKSINNIPEINTSNKESKYNNFLLQFIDSFYQNKSVYHEYYISTNYMDIHQFITYNNNRKQKQLNFFAEFFANDSLNTDFKNYVVNTINYGIAIDRLMYIWKKRMKSENIFGDSTYFSFETPDFIENKNAFNCPAYIRFLNLYIKDTYERMVEKGELPIDKSEVLKPSVEKYKLAIKLLNKPFRNVVLYNIIYNEMNSLGKNNHADSLITNSLDSMDSWFCKKYSL